MSEVFHEIEQLLTEEPPLEVIPKVPGQLTLPFAAEEAAAAGVAVSSVEFFPVVVVFGMLAAMSAWLRPQMLSAHHGKQSLFGRFVHYLGAKLAHAVHVVEHRVGHAMSRWLGPKLRPVTQFLNVVTHLINGLTQDIGDLADNTHEALVWLRHHVVPQLINRAVAPLRASVRILANAIDAVNDRLHAAAVEIADQLEAVGLTVGRTFTGAVGQLAATVVQLWQYTHHALETAGDEIADRLALIGKTVSHTFTGAVGSLAVTVVELWNRVEVLEHTVTDTLTPDLSALRERMRKLEEYIVSAAFIALVVAAVEKALSFLTCRNMKRFGNEACAAENAVMDTFAALAFGALALASLRELTQLAQGVEGEFSAVVKEILNA